MTINLLVFLFNGGPTWAYMPKNGIHFSSGRTLSHLMRNLQIEFPCAYLRLQSYQQWVSVPLSLHHWQQVLLGTTLILGILIVFGFLKKILLFLYILGFALPLIPDSKE